MSKYNKELYLILYNIRSAHNVGAIFRTADAAGVSKIYLTGYTAKPTDRFSRPEKKISKTALGAENAVPWEYHKTLSPLLMKLKKQNIYILGLEQSPKSINYRKIKPKQKTALLIGNEVKGISTQTLKKCDVIAEIPQKGMKESLNVSVAVGIVLFRIIEK